MENTTNNEEDLSLLHEIREDNTKAFNKLFKKYFPSLCTYCYQFVPIEDVEDTVQETMIWLWENRHEAIINTSLKYYLFKMVHNNCINQINHQEIKARVENYFQEHTENSPQIDHIYLKELVKDTNKAISKLPEKYKESFLMHRYKRMSYKEIAESLNVSPKTVDYRIQQSLKILRCELKEYLPSINQLLD